MEDIQTVGKKKYINVSIEISGISLKSTAPQPSANPNQINCFWKTKQILVLFFYFLHSYLFIYLFIKRRNKCFYQKVTLGLSIFWP